MSNLLLYLVTILVWGTTWLAITFQVGRGDPLVSVVYRFSGAAFLLLLYCRLSRLRLRFSLKDHLFLALEGVLLFGVNYWLIYLAETRIVSGLAAVVGSTTVFMNVFNGALFLRAPVRPRVVAGAFFGVAGVGLVYLPELLSVHRSAATFGGLVLCLVSTLSSSFGTITAARNQKAGIPVTQGNAFGMLYGALAMAAVALLAGRPFSFDLSFPYIASLFYLTVFGSIVAFGTYLTLTGRIGADRASYAIVVTPLLALLVSSIFEGYRWTGWAVAGVALVLAGNVLALKKSGTSV